MKTVFTGAGTVLVLLSFATAASAQSTRTWVSGVGDDVNPCSRTAPCKTWAGAISKTAPKGEISALDPGGFGAVTITKSITLNGDGTLAGILAANTNGVVINAAASDVVTLRRISINGAGTGLVGVKVLQANQVNIEDCDISGFGGVLGRGVSMAPAAGTPKLFIANSRIQNNLDAGVFVSIGTTMIVGSSLVGNAGNGLNADGATPVVMISNSTLAMNGTGIHTGGAALVRMTHLDIFGNTANAWNIDIASTSIIETHVDNRIRGVGIGALTPVVIP